MFGNIGIFKKAEQVQKKETEPAISEKNLVALDSQIQEKSKLFSEGKSWKDVSFQETIQALEKSNYVKGTVIAGLAAGFLAIDASVLQSIPDLVTHQFGPHIADYLSRDYFNTHIGNNHPLIDFIKAADHMKVQVSVGEAFAAAGSVMLAVKLGFKSLKESLKYKA